MSDNDEAPGGSEAGPQEAKQGRQKRSRNATVKIPPATWLPKRTIARAAFQDLAIHYRPKVGGLPTVAEVWGSEAGQGADFFELEVQLQRLAHRKTFRIEREALLLERLAKRPGSPRGSVQKIGELILSCVAAYLPRVRYSPYVQEMFTQALAWEYMQRDYKTKSYSFWGNSPLPQYRNGAAFLDELRYIYRRNEFKKKLHSAYKKADACEKSINELVDSVFYHDPIGIRVYTARLHLLRTESADRDRDMHMKAPENDEKYICYLLKAKSRLVKKHFNARSGLLKNLQWVMIPSVGGYGEPYILALFIAGSDFWFSDDQFSKSLDEAWRESCRYADKSFYDMAFCMTNPGYSLLKKYTSNGKISPDTASLKRFRKYICYISQKSYFAGPFLPSGVDSFWRSERRDGYRKKKHSGVTPVSQGEVEELTRKRLDAVRERAAVIAELVRLEKILPTFDISKRTAVDPAAWEGGGAISDVHTQMRHQALMLRKYELDELIAAADSKIRKSSQLQRRPLKSVPVKRSDSFPAGVKRDAMGDLAYDESRGNRSRSKR